MQWASVDAITCPETKLPLQRIRIQNHWVIVKHNNLQKRPRRGCVRKGTIGPWALEPEIILFIQHGPLRFITKAAVSPATKRMFFWLPWQSEIPESFLVVYLVGITWVYLYPRHLGDHHRRRMLKKTKGCGYTPCTRYRKTLGLRCFSLNRCATFAHVLRVLKTGFGLFIINGFCYKIKKKNNTICVIFWLFLLEIQIR